MCTAIVHGELFGRNLDLEYGYNEKIAIMPRNYPLVFRRASVFRSHFAIIGMATVLNGYPLYYDATNEHGLSMAGLNFVGHAVYRAPAEGTTNVTHFELIPYLLGSCRSVAEARRELEQICLTNQAFREDLPPSQLHWLIADRQESIVAEPMAEGIRIYQNPVGVLTNNPPFPFHMEHLSMYRGISPRESPTRFAPNTDFPNFSRGLNAVGLPGDFSSPSRFVRAAFVKLNSVIPQTEERSINQFFHILGAVEQVEGCVRIGSELERTQYTSCCNTDEGIYYYKTYENHQITAVSLQDADLDGDALLLHPLITRQQIRREKASAFPDFPTPLL